MAVGTARRRTAARPIGAGRVAQPRAPTLATGPVARASPHSTPTPTPRRTAGSSSPGEVERRPRSVRRMEAPDKTLTDGRMVTLELAEWVAGLRYDDLPDDVVEEAGRALADYLGECLFVGATKPWGQSI